MAMTRQLFDEQMTETRDPRPETRDQRREEEAQSSCLSGEKIVGENLHG